MNADGGESGKGPDSVYSVSSLRVPGLQLLLGMVVLFSLFRYGHDLLKFMLESLFIDFAHYYTYATVVALGLDPFDPQAVAQVVQSLKIRRAGGSAGYPPLFYVLMRPWVLLPFHYAKVAWVVAGQMCLMGSVLLCVRQVGVVSPVRVAAVLFVVLNYQPLAEDIALGQSNALLLFLLTLAWWGLRSERPWMSAVAIAVILHIKIQYALLIPLLWWMGYRVVSVRALLLTGLGLGASLVVLGPAHHIEYLRYVTALPDYLLTWTGNLSPRATLHRIFETTGLGRTTADGLWLAFGMGILFLVARAIPRTLSSSSPAIDWAWGLGLALILLLSPLTEEHHLVVLLLPLMLLLLNEPPVPLPAWEMAVLIGSVLLLGSHYSLEQFPAFHHGALSLFATGKLVGVLGLAWVLAARLRAANGRESNA